MALPVQDITAKDAVLIIWATNPLLPEAFEAIRAWGFLNIRPSPLFGPSRLKMAYGLLTWAGGQWGTLNSVSWRLGGRPQQEARNVRQLVVAERTVHSRKPPEVRERIVELMGDVPRIELFARNGPRDGIAGGLKLHNVNTVQHLY